MDAMVDLSSSRARHIPKLVSRIGRRFGIFSNKNDDDLVVYPDASLPGLPNELLLGIVDYLQVSETACLSLCSRLLHSKLESMTLDPLSVNSGANTQRRAFLVRLARLYPGLFFCHTCKKLQHSALLETPRTGYVLGGLECTGEVGFLNRPRWGGSNYTFLYQHVQLVMVRHLLGAPHGIAIDELAASNISGWYRTPLLQDNHTFNAEGRIVDDVLCLRLQDIVVFSHDSTRRFDWDLGINICAHVELPRYYSAHNALWCKITRIEDRKETHCPGCDNLQQCNRCNTEFKVDVRAMGSGMIGLVITKWINLGRGETPMDPKWRRNLPPTSYCNYNGKTIEADEHHGTRAGYERREGVPVKELTDGSLGLLRRRVVREIHPLRDRWVYLGPHRSDDAAAKSEGARHLGCSSSRGCGPECPSLGKGYRWKEDAVSACVVM